MTYSRRLGVEEKHNKRRAYGFILLSVGFVLVMFFYGLPLLVKLANLVYDFKKTSQPIDITDTTPPPPPRIDPLPGATKDTSVTIQGSGEAGVTILININGVTNETVSDADGKFSLTTSLEEGQNFIKASAKDASGNQSLESQGVMILLDKEPPEVSVAYPANNAEFFGSNQKNITIKGSTEPDAKVQINERWAIVGSDGNFTFNTTLNQGKNTFNIKATDDADNSTEIILEVSFQQ